VRAVVKPRWSMTHPSRVGWLCVCSRSTLDRLVHQRGWSIARFQAWLTEALQVQLLGQAPKVG
jgi:hypothetical protein